MCVLPKAIVCRYSHASALAAFLLLSAGGQVAAATSGCLSSAQSLSEAEINAFLAEPTELLERFPTGGPAMAAKVLRLAASDIATVPDIIALTEDAKPAHIVALSTGLGRAAAHCAAKRPDLAHDIKKLVAGAASSSFRALFSSEATVTELALGASADGQSPEESVATAADIPGAPSEATLKDIIKARVPGFLLPTNFGRQEEAASGPRRVTPERADATSSLPGSPSSDETAATAAPSEPGPDLGTSSIGPGSEVFSLFGAIRQSNGGEESVSGPEWWDHDGKRHWTSTDDTAHRPSFGTGGLIENSRNVTSPAR